MATLNGRDIVTTWSDLLRFENAGEGLPADGNVLKQVEDGKGNTAPMRVSRTKIDIISGFMLGGVAVTATATQLNSLVDYLTAIEGNTTDIQSSRSTGSLPASLKEGQLHMNLDTSELHHGDDVEAVLPVKLNGSNLVGTVPDSRLTTNVALRNGILQTGMNAEQWNGHKVSVGTSVPGDGVGDDDDIYLIYTA